ncbi:hypothetical protein L1987_86359 [Smallanthus sonchifolius]|uniref:Uncharacterized protein n=1 Tax=Smallanthus sonchifolius TaxID=185202 RepID=A0ACB8Y061_9ASTR|nr:hypothetical protein L1987_86359 [Smallanthus sonchifolius]
MAAQHTFSAITHRAIPQLLKPRLQDTTFVHDRRHKWSVTIQDPLKWYSNPNKSLCKCMDRPRSLQEPMQDDIVVKQAKLVEVVRELITNDNNGVKFDDLLMVDALERLGLDYHYEDEINQILEQCNLQFINKDFIEYRNLYEWATLCDAFLVEAKWFASGHIPKSEEYLKNGIVSSGVQVFLVHMFFLLGDGANKESANLIDNNHEIVSSVSKILRLSDDLESEEDENQDGHDGSYVKCFMMEHEYSSAKTAREYVKKMISDVWKCLNKECLSPSPFSENFLKGSLNLARFVPSMYSYSHNNSFDLVEEYIRSIL